MESKTSCKEICEECNYLIDSGWCDKVDDYVINMTCDEEVCDELPRPYIQPKRENKYLRNERYKRKLKRIADITKHLWFSPAWRVDHDGWWTDDPEETLYIKRSYVGSRSSYLKNRSDRKIRRYSGEIPQRGGYKRVFDYQWELW